MKNQQQEIKEKLEAEKLKEESSSSSEESEIPEQAYVDNKQEP